MPEEPYDHAVATLFARQPNRMVPDLDRITTLLELLGRPEQGFPAIQLTGTNGKTSSAHMATALLGALGLTAGTYTSPHLQDVRERIRVGGEPIARDGMVDALEYLAPFLIEVDARHPERVTFFEVLTALALTHFADRPVDVAVMEVGMGGRWDATNLVRGEVAVIGPVALDHLELGANLEQVALEKAGIIKPGATVVVARQEAAVMAVLEEVAAAQRARMVVEERDFGVRRRDLAVGGQMLAVEAMTATYDDVYLPLHGAHQATNAACALVAVEALLGFAGGIDAEVVREGFAAVRSPGRLEIVRRPGRSTVVLDGAHNPAGARALTDALRSEFGFRSRVMVLGVLGDKDVEGIVRELLPVADHLIVTEPPTGRAAPADRIEKAAQGSGHTVERAEDVADAIERASGVSAQGDAVVVTGSLYTVGAARDALGLGPA